MPFSTNTILLSFFYFVSVIAATPASPLSTSNANDALALLAFKAAIVSDPLNALTSWNHTLFFCTWKGVTCGRRHRDRVVSINLMSQGLVGSLSPYIGNLSFLRTITLANNSFHGEIPPEIGRLRRLRYIEFSNNSFSGEIPKNLSHCVNLYYLALMSNGLTGSIIPEFSHLAKLNSLGLALNRLSGTIPPCIGNLTYLYRLSLAYCGLEGQIPESLAQLQNLRLLDLSENNLTGSIPPQLFNNSSIFMILLGFNRLQGTIPSDIGSTLPNLQAIDLNNNKLSGEILVSLLNVSTLENIYLARCDLTGQIPESLAWHQNLRWLQLSENSLTGSIPPQLFNSSIIIISLGFNRLQGTIPSELGSILPNLQRLELNNNNLSGEIPVSLSNASSLDHLSLASNNFIGSILNNFKRLTNLQQLNLAENNFMGDVSFISSLTNCTKLNSFGVSYNLLNGSLPNSIANLSKMFVFFSMGSNHIHGRVPPSIGDLLNLEYLILGNNYFSGRIPSSIGKLVKLQVLNLEGNRFTVNLPPSLGNLTMLNRLVAGHNNISGSIPQSFNNFHSLLTLDLSYNKLNGSIPRQVLSLSSISILLNLDHNELTGPIPPEVGLLRNLGELYLSNNRLSGFIPEEMGSCASLESLHLQGNSFQGEIPAGLGGLNGLQELDVSRNHLSGRIPSFLGELRLLNLNLSFNNFQGEVPTSGVFRNKSTISIEGNIGLCGGIHELRLQSCPTSNHSKRKDLPKVLKIVLPIGGLGVIFSVLMVFICVVMYKRRMRRKLEITSMPFVDGQVMRLSYGNLLKATSGYSEANLIGTGRFGSVYKGSLDDRETMLAIKVLNLDIRGASKTFMAECNALREIRHRNLIKLLSVCIGNDFQGQDFKALVYEFKSNGNLEKWLHHNAGEEGDEIKKLTMIERLNIAIDIASALEYLHHGTNSTIIHGDLKPSNILLDNDMTACIGDFGLASIVSSMSKDLLPGESSSVAIKGTIGYIAPEYGMGDTVTTQGDVYSCGILILEMFTNIRPTDNAFIGHDNLHGFVSRALPNNMPNIIDPSIVQETEIRWDNKTQECALSILRIGVACSIDVPRDRMTMIDVVTDLIKIRNVYLATRRH